MTTRMRTGLRFTLGTSALAVVAGMLTAPPASAAPAAPTGLTPNDGSTRQYKNLELAWSPVSGATAYDVEIDDDGDFGNGGELVDSTTVTAYAVPVALPRGGYAWRVRAKGTSGTGEWSAPAAFVRGWTDGPTGLQAVDGKVPSLRWDPLPDASFYEVEISDQPFDQAPSDTGRVNHWICYTNHTSLAPYGVAAGREDPPGDESGCPFVFDSTAKPAANGAFPGKYFPDTFYWRVRGRDTSVDTRTATFADPAVSCTGVWPESGGTGNPDGSVTVPLPYGPPKYTSTPECSRWSNGGAVGIRWSGTVGTLRLPRVFGTSAEKPSATIDQCPQPEAPPPPADPNAPKPPDPVLTATLSIVGGDAGHDFGSGHKLASVVVAKDDWAKPVQLVSTETFAAALAAAGGSTLQGAYRLLASCATDGAVTRTFFSDRIIFTSPTEYEMYRVDPTSTAVHPTAGDPRAAAVAVSDTPRFSWSGVPDAAKYRVYLSRTPDFLDSDHIWETMATSLQPVGDFADRGLATYWGVQACGVFRCGKITPMKSFTKAAKSNVQALTTLVAGTVATLSWSTQTPAAATPVAEAPEAKGYQLQVDEADGDFSKPAKDVTIDRLGTTAGVAYWRFSTSELPTQFIWRVRAITETGYGLAWSATKRYDKLAPTVRITTAGGFGHTTSLTLTFSEPVTGVSTASLQVRADGATTGVTGTLTQLSSTSWRFTPSAPWVVGQYYRVAVTGAVKDHGGNAAVASTAPVRSATTVDSASPALSKVAADYPWYTATATSAIGGSYVLTYGTSSSKRPYVRTTVRGGTLYVYGCKSPKSGKANVYVDSTYVATLDLYRSYSGCGLVYSRGLPAGQRVITISAIGARNPASRGTAVGVDALKVS